MNTINTLFRYIGYAAFSILIGWLSFLGKEDFIGQIGGIVITVLLALLSLYVALSGQVITQMISLHNRHSEFKLDGIVDAMKRNVIIEIILVVISLLLLSVKSFIISSVASLVKMFSIGSNAFITFTMLYFLLVIYDSFNGLFKLIKQNASE